METIKNQRNYSMREIKLILQNKIPNLIKYSKAGKKGENLIGSHILTLN